MLHVSNHQSTARFDWFVELPMTLLIFFSPLAIGSVHLWSLIVVWILAMVAFLSLVVAGYRRKSAMKLYPMGALLLAASGLTLFQLIPVPAFMVRLLNPASAELFDFVLGGTGLWDEAGWRSLSLQPPATAVELIKWSVYGLVFLVVINRYTNRHHARRLLKTVAWSGFVVALVGFFSKLFMADSILGVYAFKGEMRFFSTFVNSNHLAGYTGLCTPLIVGLALSSRYRQEKALYAFMAVITGAALIASLSRGGMIAFGIGCVFLMVFAMTRSMKDFRKVLMIQVVAAGVLLIAGYLFYDTIINELRTLGNLQAIEEDAKIRGWEGTLPMMAQHPIVGVGRGAFSTAYPKYKSVMLQGTFSHAENQVLQYMTEWGPLFGGLFVVGFVICFLMALRRAKHSFTMGGCLAGIFAVSAHNLVDFNLEIVGVALPFVVVLGVLAVSPFTHAGRPTKFERYFRLPYKIQPVLLGLTGLIGGACLSYAASNNIDRMTDNLMRHANVNPTEPCSNNAFGMAACEIMRSHPADFMTPLLLGKLYLQEKPPKLQPAIHWLNRAQYLNPTMSLPHWLSGRALYLGGYEDQAMLEYRSAIHLDQKVLPEVIEEIFRLTKSPEMAIRATPNNAQASMQLAVLLTRKKEIQAAKKAARRALELDSSLLSALDLLGELAWMEGRMEDVLGLAKQTIEMDPLHDKGYYKAGLVYYAQNQRKQAEEVWLEGLSHVPESTQLSYRIVDLYLSENRIVEAEKIADRLRTFSRSDDYSQSRLSMLAGKIQSAKGRLFEARKHYRQASMISPSNLESLHMLAITEENMGNWIEARRIYEQLLVGGYRKEEMQQKIDAMKTAVEQEKHRARWENLIEPESQ